MNARDKAIKQLLGRTPSRRYKKDSVLSRMVEKFPGHLHVVAEHLAHRIEESGGEDCPAGRRLTVTMECELLALRNVLLAQVLEDGLTGAEGNEHKHLKTVLRITDQISRLTNLLGLDPPPRDSAPINITALWSESTNDNDNAQGEATDANNDTDTDTDTDNAQGPPLPVQGEEDRSGTVDSEGPLDRPEGLLGASNSEGAES